MPCERPLDFDRDGADWPHRESSRFVTAGGVRFHVQIAGSGPPVLLLHGLGAASHSWRGVLPLLAERFTVVVPDMPGHGFTAMPSDRDMSLPAMARALAALLRAIDVVPVVVAGHSAGAAVLVRMALDGRIEPRVLISLNGALLPFRGFMAKAFAPAARLLARLPLVPPLFAALAGDDAAVARLLRDTGSTIDAQGLRLYSRLVRNPAHVAGALAMMAQWDLAALERDLPALTTRLLLVVGRNDRTVPAADAYRVRSRVQRATIVAVPGLGHLAHEERPELAAALIAEALTEVPA